jgi:hypothetical protein
MPSVEDSVPMDDDTAIGTTVDNDNDHGASINDSHGTYIIPPLLLSLLMFMLFIGVCINTVTGNDSNSNNNGDNGHGNSSGGMMDDGDDEIIQELPVYLSQELINQLYILQYPLRPATRPYASDMGSLDRVQVKPNQRLVEMTYKLDTRFVVCVALCCVLMRHRHPSIHPSIHH